MEVGAEMMKDFITTPELELKQIGPNPEIIRLLEKIIDQNTIIVKAFSTPLLIAHPFEERK